MSQTISITIETWRPLPNGRIRAKIKETHFPPERIVHNGKTYGVVKALGRGRLILRKDG